MASVSDTCHAVLEEHAVRAQRQQVSWDSLLTCLLEHCLGELIDIDIDAENIVLNPQGFGLEFSAQAPLKVTCELLWSRHLSQDATGTGHSKCPSLQMAPKDSLVTENS